MEWWGWLVLLGVTLWATKITTELSAISSALREGANKLHYIEKDFEKAIEALECIRHELMGMQRPKDEEPDY